jgi:hypothetical protein
MIDFIFYTFCSYIITLVLAKGSIFNSFRIWVKQKTPKLKIKDYPHFIECRLCLGFWGSILICLLYNSPHMILPVYGASYFLATQERG